jgi:signal transduction histidine kinase
VTARPGGDTEAMLRTLNSVSRALGFAWLGVFGLVLARSTAPYAIAVQVSGYCVAAAAMIAWILLDVRPELARYRGPWRPLVLGVLAVSTGAASGAGGGGSLLVIFTCVATLVAGSDIDATQAIAVTAAGILAIEVSGLAYGSSVGVLIGFPAVVLAGLLTGRNRGDYRIRAEQAAALLAQREQLESEQRRADLLAERARIAREIHDVLAHSLGALGIQIQAAKAVLTDSRDIDKAAGLLTTAQQMAAEGLVETRRAIYALRTDSGPLDEELARVSDTYAQRYQVAVSYGTGGTAVPLPPDASLALLRTAQEALVNAAKYAAGRSVQVRLDYTDAGVRLTVRNDLPPHSAGTAAQDGAAAPVSAGPADRISTVNGGYGLTGMRERLQLLNGTLEAGRRDDEWIVTAELPRMSLRA